MFHAVRLIPREPIATRSARPVGTILQVAPLPNSTRTSESHFVAVWMDSRGGVPRRGEHETVVGLRMRGRRRLGRPDPCSRGSMAPRRLEEADGAHSTHGGSIPRAADAEPDHHQFAGTAARGAGFTCRA